MKISIPAIISDSTKIVMQKLGYFENYDRKTGKISYIRRLSREGFYPRFHVYIDEAQNGRLINLHLDQKKPSYAGASAHNAEYDSEVVRREAQRMQAILSSTQEKKQIIPSGKGEKKKEGLWNRIFKKIKF